MEFFPVSKNKWIHSLIFLQIPKTASTSLSSIIGHRNLVEKHKSLFDEKFGKSPLYRGIFDTRHALPHEITSIFSRQVHDYFSFTVVREPKDRLASAYSFGKENKLWKAYDLPENTSPDEFVDWLWENRLRRDILILRQQVEWVNSKIFKPTCVLRFEDLDNQWNKMINDYRIEGLGPLPHKNKSNNLGAKIFSPESLKKIDFLYRDDYAYLNY